MTPSGFTTTVLIAHRECSRMLRQPARIAAAIGTPLLLWLFFAGGFGNMAVAPGTAADSTYGSFLLPGMVMLTAVFSAIFTSLSVIEDRREGWLQCVIVAPVPRWSIALGKIVGGSIIAFFQTAMVLLLLPFLDHTFSLTNTVLACVPLACTCVAVTALGVAFAWKSRDAASFHAVMNLVFMPLWLLSGAIFPAESATRPLLVLTTINPLAWCTACVRQMVVGNVNLWPCIVTAAFMLSCIGAAMLIVRFAKPPSH